jgi:hypothetical protein
MAWIATHYDKKNNRLWLDNEWCSDWMSKRLPVLTRSSQPENGHLRKKSYDQSHDHNGL